MFSLLPVKRSQPGPVVFDRLFDDPFFRFFEDFPKGHNWSPAVEIHENGNEVQLHVELPGLEEKDVAIEVNNGVLTLSGERSQEKKEENGEYVRSERYYGRFSRSFTLPKSADLERVAANLKNGVLTISVPKREEAKPRRIEVRVS